MPVKKKKATPKKKVASGTNKYLTTKRKKNELKREIKSSQNILKGAAKGYGYKAGSAGAKRLAKATKTAKTYGRVTGKNIITGKNLKSKVAKRGAAKSKKK